MERAIRSVLGEEELADLYAHVESCDACRSQLTAPPQAAALEDDLKWADEVWSQSSVDVSVSRGRGGGARGRAHR